MVTIFLKIQPFMGSIKILFIITLLLTHQLFPEIRYVSKTGSSTPPFNSWETSADSIMECINISNFGDTIYVGNGVYKEKVVMIPGLSLIGAGMDSCIIDTWDLITAYNQVSVSMADSCLLQGFNIKTYYNSEWGWAIGVQTGTTTAKIVQNKISKGKYGFSGGGKIFIYYNIFNHISQGVHLFNSDAVVKNNVIITDPESEAAVIDGVDIEAYFLNLNFPVIDSNYIEVLSRSGYGIYKSFGSIPTIINNIILLNYPLGEGQRGIFLGSSDSAKIYNNVIIKKENAGYFGIANPAVPYLKLYNNYIYGNFNDRSLHIGPDNIVKNIVITGSSKGVSKYDYQPNPIFQYNNVWNNDVNYMNFTPDSTNISVNPMVINDDITQGDLDFHLQMYSRLIDAGDPDILDKDSTRSDIGLYGGPFGESYKYEDIPPSPPRGLSVSADTGYVTVKWRKNTETDFDYYKLYRDTIQNFIANETTLISSQADTSYIHIINPGVGGYYYKLRGVDKQGNQSKVSEEINIITDVSGEPVIVNDYRLYQNYPNPFNPTTIIGYRLKERGYVKVMVYTPSGELIEVLVNQEQESGYHEREFNPQGRLSSGVYIYQIMVKNENNIPVFSDMKKMMYLK